MSEINETLKKMIDELDLDRRVNDMVEQAETMLKRAVETAAGFAHEHRDDVDRTLDRITAQIDERTDGKFADHVDKVRGKVELGLEKLTERRPEDPS
ncbi:MAG: hypothetical protein JWQ93_922 [Marmoricola sp.]|jgi:ElaB/YqjD/DUF883 family membrane-anchored ribosome-binding protein|nr:hypothetical protein [Marmoricola sp.]